MVEIERRIARSVPPHEILAAIDSCAAMPGAEQFRAGLQAYRVDVLSLHGPDDDLIEAIHRLAAMDREAPALREFSLTVIAACSQRPVVAELFLPPLIARLEAARAAGDGPFEQTIAMARQVCQRLGVLTAR